MDAEASHFAPVDQDFWSQGLNGEFFSSVYKRAAQVGTIAVLLCLAFEQRHMALGLISGLVMGLFSMWTVEVTVRLLFHGGAFPGLKLALAAFVKMPLLLGGLLGIAWASYNGFMNVFGVVGGVLIAHGTMLSMVLATAIASEPLNRERYRRK